MDALKRRLQTELEGDVRFDEPMYRHTTYRVGGPADVLVLPASNEDVIRVVKATYEAGAPLFVMGSGSNLLVHDDGLRGVVMRIGHALGHITLHGDRLTAFAGALLPKVAKIAASNGLTGLEWGGGVPGTVGGAVSMNAGAHGSETCDTIRDVVAVNREGELCRPTVDQMDFRYRQSGLVKGRGLIVLEASFQLNEEDPRVVMKTMKQFAMRRRNTQPLGQPSSGSVFRNPPGDFAGRLIESVGLKGFAIGRAAVSDVHGNFIVNLGGAKASDVQKLIHLIKARVKQEAGVDLRLEVELVGWGDF